MTKVRFKRFGQRQYIVTKGHQQDVGESLYCAGISALMCTLACAAAEEQGADARMENGDGMKAVSAKRSDRLDAMFDCTYRGLKAMSIKWPERVTVSK